jgi:hypothetical protein
MVVPFKSNKDKLFSLLAKTVGPFVFTTSASLPSLLLFLTFLI